MTMSGRKPKPGYGSGAMATDDAYWDMVNNVPEPNPNRPGWLQQRAPGGGFISWEASARPSIMANHIDGPLLTARNGQMHWLTLSERFWFWWGSETAESLEYKHWPELASWR